MTDENHILVRRLQRERAARLEAESLLEKKSLELYQSNQKIIQVNENLEKLVIERTEKLRASESNYQSLVESISDLIFKINLNGEILFLNKIAGLTLGYDIEDIISRNIFDFLDPRHKKRALKFALEVFRSNSCMGYIELPIRTKRNKQIWLGINIQLFGEVCLTCSDKPCYLAGTIKEILSNKCSVTEIIVVARDISKQLESKQTLENQRQKLEINEKYLKSINLFASSVLKHNTIEELAWEVVNTSIKEMGFVDCIVYIFDDEKKNLIQRSAYGPKHKDGNAIVDPIIIPVGNGIVGTVARNGVAEMIADTSKDPRYIEDDQFRYSELAVPIVADGEVIGVIDTEHPEKNFYQQEHLDKLETLAGLVSARMKNAINQEKLIQAQVSLSKLSTAVEQNPLAIVITNIDGIIEFVNPAFCEITGYSPAESIGKKTNILKSGIHSDRHYTEMWNTIKRGDKWIGELTNKKKNGELYWVLVSISPIRDEKNEIRNFVAMQADISSSKKLESDLIKAKELAEKANRAKSEFLANMSHEIRTPMNAILGFSEALYHDLDSNKHKKLVHSVLSSGNLLLALLNDILDLSKIEAGKLEISKTPCNLETVLEETLLLFSEKSKRKGLAIQKQISKGFPAYLNIDEVRIKQVLFNLLGNAIKFTDEGYIKIRLEYAANNNSTGDLTIEIQDSGIGIKEEYIDSIFEAFSQQSGRDNRAYEGAGLGLSITKRLLEIMNGTIHVKSRINNGSVFTVRVPGVEVCSSSVKREEVLNGTESYEFRKATVLMVDDVPMNIKLVENFLQGTSLTFLAASNANEALKILGKNKPDLILLDIRMPQIDGFSLARIIKNDLAHSKVPIVAFTASVHSSDKILNSGDFSGALFKPVNRNDLLKELKKHLKYELSSEKSKLNKDKTQRAYTDAEPDIFPETVKILKDQFLPLWSEIKDQYALYKIEEFANDLSQYALKWDLRFLREYAQKLLEDLEIVDLDALSVTLGNFPQIIEDIVNAQKRSNNKTSSPNL